MPTVIYHNGSLAIVSFDVQENRSGSWVKATGLGAGVPYRFACQVLNNSDAPGGMDVSNMKVADLFNPANLLLPGLGFLIGSSYGVPIAFSRVTIAVESPTHGLYRFYSSSSYTEPWTPAGQSRFDGTLGRNQRVALHVYFKWGSGPTTISPLGGGRLPRVSLNAVELKIAALPNGPLANLQPNT